MGIGTPHPQYSQEYQSLNMCEVTLKAEERTYLLKGLEETALGLTELGVGCFPSARGETSGPLSTQRGALSGALPQS